MYKAPIYSVRVAKPSIKAILQVNGKRLYDALEDYRKNGYEVLSVKKIMKGGYNVSGWYTVIQVPILR